MKNPPKFISKFIIPCAFYIIPLMGDAEGDVVECDENEAQIWAVYRKEGKRGIKWVKDCDNKEQAAKYIASLETQSEEVE